MVTKGERGGWIDQEFGVKIYTLLYIKQITNKDLLYSTWNYTQYLLIMDTSSGFSSTMEENVKNECIYLYINHFAVCTPETSTTL